MASFWLWLAAVIVSLIAGAVLIILIYGGVNSLRDLFSIRKQIPKSKNKISEYIKENPEKFDLTNPGLPLDEDKKEVKQDERRRADKYREFEKLRQLELKSRSAAVEKSKFNNERVPELPGQSVLQDGDDPRAESNNGGDTQLKRSVKLDD